MQQAVPRAQERDAVRLHLPHCRDAAATAQSLHRLLTHICKPLTKYYHATRASAPTYLQMSACRQRRSSKTNAPEPPQVQTIGKPPQRLSATFTASCSRASPVPQHQRILISIFGGTRCMHACTSSRDHSPTPADDDRHVQV